jgi:hypothetical protein
MYAYDIMNNCFLKYVIPKKLDYPALFFYAINNHMYLVKDPAKCKSLTERAKTNHSFNTLLVGRKRKSR